MMRFSSENRPNFPHLFETSCYHHLLVKLWTLRQIRGSLKIEDGEHVGATLGCLGNNFASVYFIKPLFIEKLAYCLAKLTLNLKNSRNLRTPKIQEAPVETCVEISFGFPCDINRKGGLSF